MRQPATATMMYSSVHTGAKIQLGGLNGGFASAAYQVPTLVAVALLAAVPGLALVEFAASWGLSETYRDEVPGEYAKSVLDQDTLREGVVHVTDVENDPRIWHPELVRDEPVHPRLLRGVGVHAHRTGGGVEARDRLLR